MSVCQLRAIRADQGIRGIEDKDSKVCEFCKEHGEGKKWYLSASNYAVEVYEQSKKPKVADLLGRVGLVAARPPLKITPTRMQEVAWRMAPGLVRRVVRGYQQDVHWGQIVPLEEAQAVVDMTDWAVRLPCLCREQNRGDKHARYCLGIGIAPLEEPLRKEFRGWADPSLDLEILGREETKKLLADFDREGTLHSVWTYGSPFIGNICNCDLDCGAYKAQTGIGYQVMFRAEYVARIDHELCTGCRLCGRRCLFDAIEHDRRTARCSIREERCYGCGACRAVCKRGAIRLIPREESSASGIWGV